MRTDDGYIIHKCLNGEPEAFGLLIDKYKAGIYAFIYTKLRNFHDAEDVSQDVFIHAYRKLHSLRRWDSFAGWLYRIASNLCKNFLLAQSRRPDGDFLEDKHPKVLEEPPTNSHRDEAIYDYLNEALDSLPEIYRQALTLYYLGGMDSVEIGKALCISPVAVRHRISRARARLRDEVLAMMSETYREQKLQSLFTFRIIEAIKNIRIHPTPRIGGLSWGLSGAIGIIITILSMGHYLVFREPIDLPISPELLSEPKVLKTGEILVNISQVAGIPILASSQKDEPQNQQEALLNPQAEAGQWKRKSDMPVETAQFATAVVNGRIYALGGFDSKMVASAVVGEYDPISDSWTRKADMPTPRMLSYSANSVDGIIYTIGNGSELSVVEAYDPAKDEWTKKADMPTARSNLCTCVLNGKIYAIGGGGVDKMNVPTVEEYDPVKDLWTKKADMPTARLALYAIAINDRIYAMGGDDTNGASFGPGISTVEEYNPAKDTWSRKSDMPFVRRSFSGAVLNGKIYIFGGYSNGITVSDIAVYDPKVDTWEIMDSKLPTPRRFPCCNEVNGKIYVIGGFNSNIKIVPTVEEYIPEGWPFLSIFPQDKSPTKSGEIKN